jgi:hypothetical protein
MELLQAFNLFYVGAWYKLNYFFPVFWLQFPFSSPKDYPLLRIINVLQTQLLIPLSWIHSTAT